MTAIKRVPTVRDIRREELAEFRQTIQDGMALPTKYLSSLLLWNSRGLELFDKFAATDAYYLSKKEMEIIQLHCDDIISTITPGSIIIELGSGNHAKTALILRSLETRQVPFTYIALDVNREELERNLLALSQLLSSSSSSIYGLQGTYNDLGPWLARSSLSKCSPNITFLWFGNSIANSTQEEATETLARLQSSLSPSIQHNVQFFIAVDGCTDSDRLLDCYNPRSAALHAFIFNGLHHANEVLGKHVFNRRDWDLDVRFDENENVLEVFYKARRPLLLNISGVVVGVRDRERIKAIVSGKWNKHTVVNVATAARLRLVHELQHRDGDYSLYCLRPDSYAV